MGKLENFSSIFPTLYWLHQLCKKFTNEPIFNIWRNEKYFLVLLIYQLFGYYLGKIKFVLDFSEIVTKQLINKQN